MNTKSKPAKAARGAPKVVPRVPDPADKEAAHRKARMALSPSLNGAGVAHEYLKQPFGDLDMGALVDCLSGGVKDVWAGDMKRAEAMLYGQAAALQAIFTNLARRANAQEYLRQMETYLRLALKAQSQCRATLETLATIKAGPVVIARQANIAHGPQQVNNGGTPSHCARAGADESESAKTELMVGASPRVSGATLGVGGAIWNRSDDLNSPGAGAVPTD